MNKVADQAVKKSVLNSEECSKQGKWQVQRSGGRKVLGVSEEAAGRQWARREAAEEAAEGCKRGRLPGVGAAQKAGGGSGAALLLTGGVALRSLALSGGQFFHLCNGGLGQKACKFPECF